MKRQEEIKELLKSLLGKADKAIDNNHFSSEFNNIISSSEELVVISKKIEQYLLELKQINP